MGAYMIEHEKQINPLDVDTFVQYLDSGQLQVGSPERTVMAVKTKSTVKRTVDKRETWPLTHEKPLRQSNIVPLHDVIVLPWITKVEIDDRAKAD